jgi:hypothetical protein
MKRPHQDSKVTVVANVKGVPLVKQADTSDTIWRTGKDELHHDAFKWENGVSPSQLMVICTSYANVAYNRKPTTAMKYGEKIHV